MTRNCLPYYGDNVQFVGTRFESLYLAQFEERYKLAMFRNRERGFKSGQTAATTNV